MSDILSNINNYLEETQKPVEEKQPFGNPILDAIYNAPIKLHNTFGTKGSGERVAKASLAASTGTANQLAFGIPEAVIRATGGNKKADTIFDRTDPNYNIGEVGGTMLSMANPVGNVVGGGIKAGKIASAGAKGGIPALLEAAKTIAPAAKLETRAATGVLQAGAIAGIDATIQEAMREAATGHVDWGNVLMTGGVSALTGGLMRKLTPKSSAVDPDILQAAAEQKVATMGPLAPVKEATFNPSKGGSKTATATDAESHIFDQAKFISDNKIPIGAEGRQKTASLISQYKEEMNKAFDAVKNLDKFKTDVLPINAIGAMRTRMAEGLGNSTDVMDLQKGIDKAYKDIAGSPDAATMHTKIDNIMDNTRDGAAVGKYGDKGAFTLAAMARNNLFGELGKVSPDAAKSFINYGMAKEVDRQLTAQMYQSINTPVGSKTAMSQGIGKAIRGDIPGALGDVVGANVGGSIDTKVRNAQRAAKANQFEQLLKQDARSKNPNARAAETALVTGVPPVAGALATTPNQAAAQPGQPGKLEQSPENNANINTDQSIQARMRTKLENAIVDNWNTNAMSEMGGGEISMDNPVFVKYAQGVLNQMEDENGNINPQKMGSYALVQEKDKQNFEDGFNSWQLINSNLDKALKGTVPLGGFEKSDIGSNVGAWLSSLNSKYTSSPDVKTARQNIVDGFNLLAKSAGGTPGVAGDTAERLLSQATSLDDAKKKMLALMKEINPSSYSTLQSVGIIE